MTAEFRNQFAEEMRFDFQDAVSEELRTFGETYNEVFSISKLSFKIKAIEKDETVGLTTEDKASTSSTDKKRQIPLNTKKMKAELKKPVKNLPYDVVQTYTNASSDQPFLWITPLQIRNAVKAIHSVGADGNCGFHAVSLGVYNDQEKWIQVKQDMLHTYLKYKSTLYKAALYPEREEEAMLTRLRSTKSPCLAEQNLWFSTFVCPQIVTDTYSRPVILFSWVENRVRRTGELKRTSKSQTFVPLMKMEPSSVE